MLSKKDIDAAVLFAQSNYDNGVMMCGDAIGNIGIGLDNQIHLNGKPTGAYIKEPYWK